MIPGVPGGFHRSALAAFAAQLMNHPRFANRRIVKTWTLWDGRSPVAPPAVAAMPAAQVRMISGPVVRLASARRPGGPMLSVSESRPTIIIDLFTAGTDQGDLSDVADLMIDALFPQDPAERSALDARFRVAGIRDYKLTREILPGSGESFDDAFVGGQGAVELTLQFNT